MVFEKAICGTKEFLKGNLHKIITVSNTFLLTYGKTERSMQRHLLHTLWYKNALFQAPHWPMTLTSACWHSSIFLQRMFIISPNCLHGQGTLSLGKCFSQGAISLDCLACLIWKGENPNQLFCYQLYTCLESRCFFVLSSFLYEYVTTLKRNCIKSWFKSISGPLTCSSDAVVSVYR